MTAADIANHNKILAQLTAEDGIRRLSWEEHGAAFKRPVPATLTPGQRVVGWDSCTIGVVEAVCVDGYDVQYPDVGGLCRYSAEHLRPWIAA